MSDHPGAVERPRAGPRAGKINLNLAPKAEPPPERRREYRDPHELDRLKAEVDTVALVATAAGVRFRAAGAHHESDCPFCGGRWKFQVRAHNGWFCAKEQRGGTNLDFLVEWHGWTVAEAVAELRRLDGGSDGPEPAFRRRRAKAAPAAPERDEGAEAKAAAALRYWAEASPELPPQAVAYWREARGLPDVPAALRWHPAAPRPAIVAPVTDGAGAVTGVHRIWVPRPATGKPRLALGPQPDGAAIRLYAAEGDTLALAEGPEDATAARAMLGVPCWSVVSAGRLPKAALPAHVRRVLIVADRDPPDVLGKVAMPEGVGLHHAHKAAKRYAAEGREAAILVPAGEGDKDANDALRSGRGLREYAVYLPRLAEAAPIAEPAPSAAKPAPFVLPAFPRPTLDNAEALAAAEYELAEVMESAVAFAAGELGEDAEPPRWLANMTVGTGKSQGYIQALAEAAAGGRLTGGVLVAVPTVERADEMKGRLENRIRERDARRRGGRGVALLTPVNVRAWRGRLKDAPDGAPMCRNKALVERVQRTGADVSKAVCARCPFREGCRYLMQAAEVRREGERTILLTSHEHLFLPLPEGFSPRLVVVDEGLGGRMTRQRLVEPETVADPRLWAGDTDGAAVAAAVATALRDAGRELAALLGAGVTAAAVERAAKGLRARYDALVAAVEDGGFSVSLDQALAAAEGADHRAVASLLEGLAVELPTDREGTNGTRMEARRFEVTADDGSKRWEDRETFVARGLRRWRVKASAAVVMLDATADKDLVERWLGAPVRYVERAIPLQGAVIQVRDVTNSKYRLLHRPEAANNRARMAKLVRDLDTLSGGSLFAGATKDLAKALQPETADAAGVTWMWFNADRGSDAAKGCRIGLPIGREQPKVQAVEDIARCFAVEREEPFVSAPSGALVPATRELRMRDGSSRTVELSTHPDPLGRAVLEQIREASVVQSAGRLRMAREPGKLLILATNLPTPIEPDLIVSQHELERAASIAAEACEGLRAGGFHLLDPKALARDAYRVESLVELVGWLLARAGNPHTSVIGSYYGSVGVSALPALYRGGARGPRRKAWLLSALPPAEAFAAACTAGHDVLPVEPAPAPAPAPEKESVPMPADAPAPVPAPVIIRRSGAGGVIRLTVTMKGEGWPTWTDPNSWGLPDDLRPLPPDADPRYLPPPDAPCWAWARPSLERHARGLAALAWAERTRDPAVCPF